MNRKTILVAVLALSGVTIPFSASAVSIQTPHQASASTNQLSGSSEYTYGSLPSWLPKSTTTTHTIIATTAKPQLVIPGDIVEIKLKGSTTTASLNGPTVNAPVNTPVVPAAFTLSLIQKSGSLNLKISDISFIDGNGALVHPTSFNGGLKEVTLHPGEKVNLGITALMSEGTGTMIWNSSGRNLVDWQFVEEND